VIVATFDSKHCSERGKDAVSTGAVKALGFAADDVRMEKSTSTGLFGRCRLCDRFTLRLDESFEHGP
jgi:hypothetical protein